MDGKNVWCHTCNWLAWVWSRHGEGAKIKTTKISSEGLMCNSAKICTSESFPLYGTLVKSYYRQLLNIGCHFRLLLHNCITCTLLPERPERGTCVQSNLEYPNPFGHVEKSTVRIMLTTLNPHPQIWSCMQNYNFYDRLIEHFNLILDW
jgi:hypothetical protein